MFSADVWGSVSDWVVAVTAIAGAVFASVQLLALRRAEERAADEARAQAETARATLLIEIDSQFESPDMVASRIAIRTVRNRAVKEAKANVRKGANDLALRYEAETIFSAYVTKLWGEFTSADPSDPSIAETDSKDDLRDDAGQQYMQLVRMLGWMETVGRLTEQKLIAPEDMFELYDELFIQICGLFRQHIADRRDEGPTRNARLWHYAFWFSEAAQDRQKRINQIVPDARDLEWKGASGSTRAPHIS